MKGGGTCPEDTWAAPGTGKHALPEQLCKAAFPQNPSQSAGEQRHRSCRNL